MYDEWLLTVATPILALASLLAVVWARRQDRQVRRQAAGMQRRLESEIDTLRARGQRIRQRILLVAEVYCGGSPAKRAELTKDCDDLLAELEILRCDLFARSGRLAHLRGRDLREAQLRMAGGAGAAGDLAREIEEMDARWTRELAAMTGLRPSPPRGVGSPPLTA